MEAIKMEETLRLWEILVPRCTNDGIEYRLEHHHEWDEKVRGLTGGITIMKPVKGQWINPDKKLFIEEMIPVRIYCTDYDIEKIIDYTLEHYDQEAILAYETSSRVRLKHKEK